MILGLFWMAVANAGVLLAARAALRRVSTGRPSVDLVLFLLLRFSIIMGLVIATGLSRKLTPAGLGTAGGLLLAVLWLRGERFDPDWKRPIPPELPRVLIVLGSFLAARSLFQVWFYTPLDGDVTQYHLPKLAEWIRTGGFYGWMGIDIRAWFPAGFELVEAWWVVFLRHDVLIETAGLEFLLLASTATWALARWMGLQSGSALLAALVVASTPGFATQSVSCMNDGPAAALILAAAVLILARVPLPLLMLCAGMAAGLKPTTLYAVPGLLLLFARSRKEPVRPSPGRLTSVVLGALGLGLGAFWYVRNWVLNGHPLFPIGTALLEVKGVPLQKIGPSFDSLLANLSALISHRLYDGRRMLGPTLELSAGWGPAVVAVGLPALVAMVRTNPRLRLLAAAALLSLLSVLLLVVPDNYNLRFVLWFAAVPALAIACAVERAPALRLPALAALILACALTTFSGLYPISTVSHFVQTDHLRVGSGCPLMVSPDGVRFAITGGGSQPYHYYGPDFGRSVRALNGETAEELAAEILRADVELLYALHPTATTQNVIKQCVRRGWLAHLQGGAYVVRAEAIRSALKRP